MSAHVDSGFDPRTRSDSRTERRFPAYGPVDAVLSLALFLFVVDRATPTVTTVVPDTFDVSPSLVGLGLACFVWFVVAVTVLDQVRRQLAALGVGAYGSGNPTLWARVLPSEARTLAYLVVLLLGGLLAAWTFDSAIETAVELIPVVVRFDWAAFDLSAFVVMGVFFFAYGVASAALDRLVVDGVRTMLAA